MTKPILDQETISTCVRQLEDVFVKLRHPQGSYVPPFVLKKLQQVLLYLEASYPRGGDDYVVPFFEKRIEGMDVTYVDMHGIYCMCREVMDTFDWEHFDLIFHADW